MTTRAKSAAVTMNIARPTPEIAAISPSDKPTVISLLGLTIPTLNEALVHSQRGYVISEADFFTQTGQVSLTLRLGETDPASVVAADMTYKQALQIERRHDTEAAEAEARRVAEEQARIEKQKQLAAQIAAQEEALLALKAEAAAAA